MNRPSAWLLSALVALLAVAAPAAAQSYTWNAPNTGTWADPLNWTGGVAPPSDATTELTFAASGASSYTATNNVANPFLLRRITLNNTGTGTITVAPAAGGGAITFAAADSEVFNLGSGDVTLSTPLNLAVNTLFRGTGTGTVTVSGPVTDGGGGFGLNLAGAGTYTFAGGGASSVNFLRATSGTTRITAGAWTLAGTATTDATAALVVGRVSGSTAAFQLTGGATLTSPGNLVFGEGGASTGTGQISGTGTTVTATGATTGQLVVGSSGTGSLTVSGGAVVNTRLGVIGRNAGSSGAVIVDGAGSTWTTAALTVGSSGGGTLTVQAGGAVNPGSLTVVATAAGTGTVTVTGAGSQLVTPGTGNIATQAGGNLTVSAGGLVSGQNVSLSSFGTAGSSALVDAGTLTARGTLTVASGGTGALTIQNGGVVSVAGNAFVGLAATNVGTVTVSGANSKLQGTGATTFLIFGGGSGAGRGDLTVQAGGAVSNVGTQVTFAQDNGSTSTSVVDAASLTATGALSIGQAGTATLTVRNGGTGTAAAVVLASNTTGNGTLTVTGAGSSVTATGVIRLAGFGTTPGGTGVLNVQSGGAVTAGGLFVLYAGGTANVTASSLTVGGLAHGTAASAGVVALAGSGEVTITNGLGATFAGVIRGAGTVTKTGPGVQAFAGPNLYTGGTTVNQGTLLVTNTTGSGTGNGGTTVNAGGTLGGTGRVAPTLGGTPVIVTVNAGTLQAGGTPAAAPTRTDTLTITQGLTFDGAASLRTTVGQSGGVGAAGKIDLATGAGRLARNTGGATTDVFTVRLTDDGTLDRSGVSYTVTVLTYFTLDPGSLSEFTNQPNPTHFAAAAENFTFSGTPLISLSGGNLSITFTPVPEPTGVLAVAAVGLGLAGWRRRRK